jgi:hypothetical protein
MVKRRKPSKPKEQVLFLVGRPFVITGAEGPIEGMVRGQVDDNNYLVELVSELVVVGIGQMITTAMGKPTWHFFETERERGDWIAENLPVPAPTTGEAADDQDRLART